MKSRFSGDRAPPKRFRRVQIVVLRHSIPRAPRPERFPSDVGQRRYPAQAALVLLWRRAFCEISTLSGSFLSIGAAVLMNAFDAHRAALAILVLVAAALICAGLIKLLLPLLRLY